MSALLILPALSSFQTSLLDPALSPTPSLPLSLPSLLPMQQLPSSDPTGPQGPLTCMHTAPTLDLYTLLMVIVRLMLFFFEVGYDLHREVVHLLVGQCYCLTIGTHDFPISAVFSRSCFVATFRAPAHTLKCSLATDYYRYCLLFFLPAVVSRWSCLVHLRLAHAPPYAPPLIFPPKSSPCFH